jgi:DNA polymerase-3 subunit epsilon
MIVVEKGIITQKKYQLIKPPELRFHWRNIQVHGITETDVEKEFEFYRYWNGIKKMLTQYGPVIAHNATFDMSVLRAIIRTYQLDEPDFEYNCSVKLSRKTWKGLPSYSLGKLATGLGFSFKHHHALEDAEMCANVVIAACKKLNAGSVHELSEMLNVKVLKF